MNRGKRLFDLVFVVPGILILLLPGLLTAVAVVVEDGWPPIYAQERVGLHGRLFRLLKFRSMRRRSDEVGARLTVGADDRVTGVGRVLRRTKLDEIPQLINVLRGDMSLVGPRPEVPEFVARYSEDQRRVLELVPGITDPASIKYADESSLLARHPDPIRVYVETIMPDKIRLSLEYARTATVWSDFLVVLQTVFGPGRSVRGQ